MIADKRYYLNADRSRVVAEDDPSATHLLAAAGADISNEDVARYGLGKQDAQAPEPVVVHSTAADPPKDEPAAVVEPEPDADAESKMVEAPAENKARRMGSKKDAE